VNDIGRWFQSTSIVARKKRSVGRQEQEEEVRGVGREMRGGEWSRENNWGVRVWQIGRIREKYEGGAVRKSVWRLEGGGGHGATEVSSGQTVWWRGADPGRPPRGRWWALEQQQQWWRLVVEVAYCMERRHMRRLGCIEPEGRFCGWRSNEVLMEGPRRKEAVSSWDCTSVGCFNRRGRIG
jgi:hypothetical protein